MVQIIRSSSRKLRSDVSASVAIEFGMLGLTFVFAVLTGITLCVTFFLHQSLDLCATNSAQAILTGTVWKANMSSDTFRRSVVCANLPKVLSCDKVVVNLYTVTAGPNGFYRFMTSDGSRIRLPSGATNYQLGGAGSYQYLQLLYPITFLPTALVSIMAPTTTYNGQTAYLMISSAAFRNEQFK